ncbi:transmembrane protein 107 isoform X3 [Oryctolagus cuniculus]|uniref:transmembrane protein 107 isoform X3 n=1 Tax=Oryctolagus cuniculus TaxID=9986 RepID=UPI00387A667E
MSRISGLVPSRFLTLLAHLVVVITLFWSRDSNVQACLPLRFTPEEYEKQDAGGRPLGHPGPLCRGAGRLPLRSVHVQQHPEPHLPQAIAAHCSASVALSFFIFERWECTTYCALPAVTEVALFIAVFGLKKKPF